MQLVRFYLPGQGPRLGLLAGDDVHDLSASGVAEVATLDALVRASVSQPIPELVRSIGLAGLPAHSFAQLHRPPTPQAPHLLPPVQGQEVWAAGVTYAWSREARVREALSKEVYVRVYDAERPELFFKSTPAKVVGPGDWIGIRGDSGWNVPEPELTVLLNPQMVVLGYTVGNDVSSRDIEGANPLYLPQAKTYRHSCALGPAITLAEAGLDPANLDIGLTISRQGATVFAGATNTRDMRRSLEELAGYLGAYNDFPQGAWLMTGTGIVPGDDFTLQAGDVVSIEIQGIGCLSNPVRGL